MPKYELKQQPKDIIIPLDTDTPLDENSLNKCFSSKKEIILCVRSKSGHPKRGGYFFRMERTSKDYIDLKTFDGDFIDKLHIKKMARFINHTSGLMYDKEILSYCQNTINLKHDMN